MRNKIICHGIQFYIHIFTIILSLNCKSQFLFFSILVMFYMAIFINILALNA